MSGVAPGTDVVAEAIADIVAEASSLRDAGRLSPGYGAELDRRFAAIAKDPDELARSVDAGGLSAPQAYRFRRADSPGGGRAAPTTGGQRGLRRLAAGASRRSVRSAKGISRRTVTTARRMAGPRLRSLERQALEQAGRVAEAIATRGQVTADHARRVATSGGSSSRLDRISPRGRTLPSSPPRARRRQSAEIGAANPEAPTAALTAWALERIGRGPGGRVLHVECGEGGLVRRMAALGYDASGADPAAEVSETILRAGALERLGSEPPSSLGGLVVSGVTEDVSPASARAIAHLASSRLRAGGVVVVVSSHPRRPDDEDPITADLALRRPLHPVTWCHLLARYGFGEITVFDPPAAPGVAPTLYAVAARRV